MRDDDLRERLLDSNPWWRAAATGGDRLAWRATDPVLAARAPFDLGYRSDLLDDVTNDPVNDKLIVLHGPRRVGKSVLLKDTAASLCSRDGFDPRQLIYLPADGMQARDLGRAAKIGRDLTRSVGEARRVLAPRRGDRDPRLDRAGEVPTGQHRLRCRHGRVHRVLVGRGSGCRA